MKKVFILLAVLSLSAAQLFAQKNENPQDEIAEKYRRSSLCNVLISHPDFQYGLEIDTAFHSVPVPDKFNDHTVTYLNIVSSADKLRKGGNEKRETNLRDIDAYLTQYDIAKRLVSKWYCRNPYSGKFDMSLIAERGLYDASQAAIEEALKNRTFYQLSDAGEELIGNTYLIAHDITYVDKGKNSAVAGAVVGGLFAIAGALLGLDTSTASDLGNVTNALISEIDGFTVNVTSYLYRLEWNEECAAKMYNEYWIYDEDPSEVAAMKKAAFDNSTAFRLTFVGETTATSSNTSSKSFSKATKGEQISKVCARVMDKAIVALQREYEDFKVKVPIHSISPDGKAVQVKIGLKEGVNYKTKYEVLLPEYDEKGKVRYKVVGTLQAQKGMVWDNRFGALDEYQEMQAAVTGSDREARKAAAKAQKAAAKEAGIKADPTIGATTFVIKTGHGKILPGMLVREARVK